jgi:hypothetical protein
LITSEPVQPTTNQLTNIPNTTIHLFITTGLNEAQQRAVESPLDTPLLILAGAGCGKTTTMAHRVAHILKTTSCKPAEVCAITFTKTAAAEMRQRIGGIVGQHTAQQIQVSTFHSLCLKVCIPELNTYIYMYMFVNSIHVGLVQFVHWRVTYCGPMTMCMDVGDEAVSHLVSQSVSWPTASVNHSTNFAVAIADACVQQYTSSTNRDFSNT